MVVLVICPVKKRSQMSLVEQLLESDWRNCQFLPCGQLTFKKGSFTRWQAAQSSQPGDPEDASHCFLATVTDSLIITTTKPTETSFWCVFWLPHLMWSTFSRFLPMPQKPLQKNRVRKKKDNSKNPCSACRCRFTTPLHGLCSETDAQLNVYNLLYLVSHIKQIYSIYTPADNIHHPRANIPALFFFL